MTLNIILTSYNRPYFLRRTLQSLIDQTSPDWRCYLMDDGSEAETLDVIEALTDHRIMVKLNHDYPIDRNAARYGVLINQIMPHLPIGGIVGYLCDNVEYSPSLVADVLDFFNRVPAFSGYVTHERDVWTPDGRYLGTAAQFNHWDITPPDLIPISGNALGLLDHSQVFHRLPVSITWPEAPEAKPYGDGLYFNNLITHYGPIYPIKRGDILTREHLFK